MRVFYSFMGRKYPLFLPSMMVLGEGDRMIIPALSWQKTATRDRETSSALAILQGWSDRPGEPKGLKHTLSFPFKYLAKSELS